MIVNSRKAITQIIEALWPSAVISLWTYFFWARIQKSAGEIAAVEFVVPAIAMLAMAAVDVGISRRGSISGPIIAAYIFTVVAAVVILTITSSQFAATGLFGVYTLLTFMTLRAAAQVWETELLHWKRSRVVEGLAVTSVLVLRSTNGEDSFVLVKNQNLNAGKGLWVSPGGRWNPTVSAPDERLIEKIQKEVNYKARILTVSQIEKDVANSTDMNSSECQWFRPPHMLLYEKLGSDRSEFPSNHLDLVYVCWTKGETAGQAPKYGATAQIQVPVASCGGSYDAAYAAVAKSVDDWHLRNLGTRPARRDDISADVVWRLHLIAKSSSMLAAAIAQA